MLKSSELSKIADLLEGVFADNEVSCGGFRTEQPLIPIPNKRDRFVSHVFNGPSVPVSSLDTGGSSWKLSTWARVETVALKDRPLQMSLENSPFTRRLPPSIGMSLTQTQNKQENCNSAEDLGASRNGLELDDLDCDREPLVERPINSQSSKGSGSE